VRRAVPALLALALAVPLAGCADGEAAEACDEAELVAERAQLELEELEEERQTADEDDHDRLETAQLRAVERWAVTIERDPDCFSEEERASSEELLETIERTGDRTLE
jgi:hypothetical protein